MPIMSSKQNILLLHILKGLFKSDKSIQSFETKGNLPASKLLNQGQNNLIIKSDDFLRKLGALHEQLWLMRITLPKRSLRGEWKLSNMAELRLVSPLSRGYRKTRGWWWWEVSWGVWLLRENKQPVSSWLLRFVIQTKLNGFESTQDSKFDSLIPYMID